MSGQYRYEISDVIPFTAILLTSQGDPINNENVRVDVFNLSDGTLSLDDQALPENASTGVYSYLWTHGFTAEAQLFAIIYDVQGNKRIIVDTKEIKITNTQGILSDKIDENDGQAI